MIMNIMSLYEYLISELDLQNVANELVFVTARWYPIGVQLGINPGKLDVFKHDHQTADRCFSEVIKFWLRGNASAAVSWESLVEVLEKPSVGEKGLARRLRKKGGMVVSETAGIPGATESGVQPQESNGGQRGSPEENLDEHQGTYRILSNIGPLLKNNYRLCRHLQCTMVVLKRLDQCACAIMYMQSYRYTSIKTIKN